MGETVGKGVYEGIGKVLSGPGIILLATVLAKLGGNLLSFVRTSGAQFLGLNKQAEEQARTQTIIGNILMQRPEVMQKILSGQLSQNDAAKVFSNELKIAEVHYAKLNELASSLAAKQRLFSGPRKGRGKGNYRGQVAEGLIPNFVPNFATDDVEAERQAATQGGYRAGQIRRMNVPGMGGVTYNGKETVKEFPGMQQPAIMPPALSQAGKDYRGQFKDTIGFDPYNAASGFVPNFAARTYKIRGKEYSGLDVSAMLRPNRKKAREFTATEAVAAGYEPSGTSPKQRAAGMKRMDASDDPREVYPVDLKGMLGLLSLRGQSGGSSPRMNLGNLPGIKDTIKNRGLTHLANDQVEFQNIAISSLQNGGYQKEGGKATGKNVSNRISNVLASPMARLAKEFHHKILGRNEEFNQTEVAKVLKASKGGFISTSTEGDIFENVVRIVTQNASGGLKETFDQNVSEKEPFDFEEGDRGVTKEFQQFMFPKAPNLRKADAKRTADPKQIRSLIKKAYTSRILNSENSIFSGKFALPGLDEGLKGSGFKADKKDIEKAEIQLKNAIKAEKSDKTLRGKALGLIPNFSLRGISNAVQREDRSGVRRDKVRVGYDRRLAASGGIGVYNTDEGSLGNAIDMHMSAGRNKSQIQRQGKASGFVPNFEMVRKLASGGDTARIAPAMKEIAETTEKATASIKQNSDSVEKGTERRERGLGSLTAMILIGGQIGSLGDRLEESENGLVSFTGTLASFGGSMAMWMPSVETGLTALGVKGNGLSEQFVHLKDGAKAAALAAFAAAKSMMNMSLSQMAFGSGGMGGIGKNFSRGQSLAKRGALGGKPASGLAGGLRGVASGGGAVGGLARGGAALVANPIGAAVAVAAVGGLIFHKMEAKAVKKQTDALNKSIMKSADKFSRIKDALSSLTETSNKYIEALKSGDAAEQKSTKRKLQQQLTSAQTQDFFKGGKTMTLDSGRKVSSEKEAFQVLSDENISNIERADLVEKFKKYSEVLDQNRESAAAFLVAQNSFNSKQKSLWASGTATDEQVIAANKGLTDLIMNYNGEYSELLTQAKQVRKDLKAAGGYVSASDSKKIRGATKALLNSLVKERTSRAQLAKTFSFLEENVGKTNESGFEVLVTQMTDGLIPVIESLISSGKRFDDAQDEAAKELSAQAVRRRRAAEESIHSLNKDMNDFSSQVSSSARILKMMRKFEDDRAKLIIDSNKKILDPISTEFGKQANANRNAKAQIERTKKIDDGDILLKGQSENVKLLKSYINDLNKGRTDEGGKTTDDLEGAETTIKSIIEDIKGGRVGLVGDTSAGKVDELINQLSGGRPKGSKDDVTLVRENLETLAENLRQSDQDAKFAIDERKKQYEEEKSLQDLKNSLIKREIKEQQKLKFGSGIFESPRASVDKFRDARANIIGGRRTGDKDRVTSGLIEQAKFLQGFEFGDSNPAAKLTHELAKQFQENAISAFESMPGGRPLTKEERADSFAIALRKAQAITKDPREIQLDLISVTKSHSEIMAENTQAIINNTAAIRQESPGMVDASSGSTGAGSPSSGGSSRTSPGGGRFRSANANNGNQRPDASDPRGGFGPSRKGVGQFSGTTTFPGSQSGKGKLDAFVNKFLYPVTNMPGSEGDPNNPDKNKWNFDNVRDLFETMKGFAKPLKNFSSGATSSGGTPLSLKQQTKKQGLDVAKRIKEFLGGKGIGVPTRVPGQSFAGASGKVPGMTSGLGMSGSFTTRPSSSISSSSSARGRVSSGSVRAAEASTPLRPTAPDIVDPNKALGKEFRRVIVTELIAKYTNFLETFGEEFYDSKGQSWMSGPVGQPRKKFKKKENFADLKKGKTAQEIAELERLEKPNARFMPFIMGSKNEPRDVNPHYKSGGMYQKGGVNDVGATHHYSMGQSVETTLRKIETFRFMLKQELLLLKGLVDELGNLTPKGEAKVLEIQRRVGPKGNPGHPGASGSLGTTSTTTTTSTVFPKSGDGSGKPTETITAVAGEKKAKDFLLAITAPLESLIAAVFKKQQGKAEEFETTGGEKTGAAAQDIMGVNRKDTQAGQFSKSDVKRTGDDIDALIRQAQEGAQASVDAGLGGVKVNQDRVNVLKHITEFEQGRSTLDKESLKNLVERYTATANFNIATKASLENQRRFTADLVTRTELQTVAQDKLNKSYHDGEKFADALGDAIGSRFQYNATTAREQFGQLTLGMVDDFKGGTKEAFGAAIRGTSTFV